MDERAKKLDEGNVHHESNGNATQHELIVFDKVAFRFSVRCFPFVRSSVLRCIVGCAIFFCLLCVSDCCLSLFVINSFQLSCIHIAKHTTHTHSNSHTRPHWLIRHIFAFQFSTGSASVFRLLPFDTTIPSHKHCETQPKMTFICEPPLNCTEQP